MVWGRAMTNQLIESVSYSFPTRISLSCSSIPHQYICPAIETDTTGNFAVVWELDRCNDEPSAQEPEEIIARRIPLNNGTASVIVAQRYQLDGTPIGQPFQIHSFTDLLKECNDPKPSRIVYCSTWNEAR